MKKVLDPRTMVLTYPNSSGTLCQCPENLEYPAPGTQGITDVSRNISPVSDVVFYNSVSSIGGRRVQKNSFGDYHIYNYGIEERINPEPTTRNIVLPFPQFLITGLKEGE